MRILSDSFICTANAVSMMSLLVRPKCSQRLAGLPMFSETLVVKATTSWFSVRSSSRQRSMVKEALSFICLRCFLGRILVAKCLGREQFDVRPIRVFAARPNVPHLGTG